MIGTQLLGQLALEEAEMPCSLSYTHIISMPELLAATKDTETSLAPSSIMRIQVSAGFAADVRARNKVRIRLGNFAMPSGATIGTVVGATSKELAVSFFDLSDFEVIEFLRQSKAFGSLNVLLTTKSGRDATLAFASGLDGLDSLQEATSNAKRLSCLDFSSTMLEVIRAAGTRRFCQELGLYPAHIGHVHIGWCVTKSRVEDFEALVANQP